MPALLEELANRLCHGDAKGVVSLTQQAVDSGLAVQEILNQGLLVGMEEVGRGFKEGNLFIPEIIVAARAMHAGVEVLRPHLTAGALSTAGVVVLGTVKGDLHDIGKKIVGIMLRGAGFEVVDLGFDVPCERFVKEVSERRPDILGLSALLSTTMPMMKNVIAALEAAGLRRAVKVLVGGAPVTRKWAEEIGADGYAPDAVTAVEKGTILPVVITVYADRSFSFILKTPPAAVLIKKKLGLDKGSATPNKVKVGKLSKAQLQEIAKVKMPDLNAADLEAAMRSIAGSARSMGVEVVD